MMLTCYVLDTRRYSLKIHKSLYTEQTVLSTLLSKIPSVQYIFKSSVKDISRNSLPYKEALR